MTAGGMGGEDLLTAKLDALISQTRQKQAATLSEVTFRGRTIPVKSEKVRVFLLGESAESLISEFRRRHGRLFWYPYIDVCDTLSRAQMWMILRELKCG